MPNLREFKRIIIGKGASYNEKRAAVFLANNIKMVAGFRPQILTDDTPAEDYELVLGRTTRELTDGLSFERFHEYNRKWSYEIKYVGKRLYLTGLGDDPKDEQTELYNAKAVINDGAQGTMYAVYYFVEEILGYQFVYYSDINILQERDDIEIDERCNFVYSNLTLRHEMPELFDGAAMYSVPGCQAICWNVSCTIFKTKEGKLIVIDGGHGGAHAEHVVEILEYLAGGKKPVVTAWLFSHLHGDHYGVYYDLCHKPELGARVEVKYFYCNLITEEYYTKISLEGGAWAKDPRDTLLNSEQTIGAKVHKVVTGDEIVVDEFSFKVLHTPEDIAPEFLPKVDFNDSGVVYKLNYNNEQTIMFLSDAEKYCSDDLLENHRNELKSDVVHVGHHGCGNVSKECYLEIGADAYLWQLGHVFWYADDGESYNEHNGGIVRTRAFTKAAGERRENTYRDTNGLLSIKLPIKINK